MAYDFSSFSDLPQEPGMGLPLPGSWLDPLSPPPGMLVPVGGSRLALLMQNISVYIDPSSRTLSIAMDHKELGYEPLILLDEKGAAKFVLFLQNTLAHLRQLPLPPRPDDPR